MREGEKEREGWEGYKREVLLKGKKNLGKKRWSNEIVSPAKICLYSSDS